MGAFPNKRGQLKHFNVVEEAVAVDIELVPGGEWGRQEGAGGESALLDHQAGMSVYHSPLVERVAADLVAHGLDPFLRGPRPCPTTRHRARARVNTRRNHPSWRRCGIPLLPRSAGSSLGLLGLRGGQMLAVLHRRPKRRLDIGPFPTTGLKLVHIRA